jgi:exopolysaccharide production protein ExoZ
MKGLRLPAAVGALLIIAAITIVWCFGASMPPTGPRIFTFGLAAVCLFAGVVLCFGQPRPASLRARIMTVLGDASYSLYLTHGIVTVIVYWLWIYKIIPHNVPAAWAASAAGLLAAVGMSIAVYYWLEKPMTRHLRRALSVFQLRKKFV